MDGRYSIAQLGIYGLNKWRKMGRVGWRSAMGNAAFFLRGSRMGPRPEHLIHQLQSQTLSAPRII
jgi:hypothetical protein